MITCGGLVVGMTGNLEKYLISLELISLKWKLVPLLGASLNMPLLMTDILQNKTFLHWLSGWQLHTAVGSFADVPRLVKRSSPWMSAQRTCHIHSLAPSQSQLLFLSVESWTFSNSDPTLQHEKFVLQNVQHSHLRTSCTSNCRRTYYFRSTGNW